MTSARNSVNMSGVAVYSARGMSSPVDILEEAEPYPSKFDLVRFYTDCIHDYWPTPSKQTSSNTVPMNSIEREAILHKMDSELHDMEATLVEVTLSMKRIIRKARYRRNHNAYINQLPPEVLCEIFAHADDGRMQRKLVFSHVCTHWRNIAVQYPFLWSTIDLSTVTNTQYLQRLVHRAGSVPLHLEYYNWHIMNHEKADYCSRLIFRTSSLKIRVATRYMRNYGTWLADKPAPILRRLEIAVSEGTAIFPRLLGNKAPNLTELTLLNCRLAWAPGLYVGLTKLSIQSEYVMQRTDPSDGDLCHIFAECPNLEELELLNCGPVRDPLSLETRTPVPLRSLRILRLCLHVVDLNYLLDIIAAPPTVCVTIQCHTGGIGGSLMGDVAAGFAFLQRLRSLDLSGSAYSMHGYADVEGSTQSFDLSIFGPHSWEVFDAFCTSIANTPPPQLRRVRLDTLDDERVLLLLERLPLLTHIELMSEAAETVYHLLVAFTDAPQLGRNLQSLVLQGTYLDSETLLHLGELAHYAPRLRRFAFYQCSSDLTAGEVVELLSQDVLTVMWSDEAIKGYDVDADDFSMYFPEDLPEQC